LYTLFALALQFVPAFKSQHPGAELTTIVALGTYDLPDAARRRPVCCVRSTSGVVVSNVLHLACIVIICCCVVTEKLCSAHGPPPPPEGRELQQHATDSSQLASEDRSRREDHWDD
jgi:hypothetical protein